jgi:hypothetical protein
MARAPHWILVYCSLATLLLAIWGSKTEATTISVPVAAHENACFFALVPEVGKKVAFYFAVGFPF